MKIASRFWILLALATAQVTFAQDDPVPGDIFAAIKLRNVNAVVQMLQNDAKQTLQATTAEGITPLHYAAQLDEAEIVLRLLIAGANPNITTENNLTTPLHWAAHQGATQSLRLLLRNHADPKLKTHKGYTAVHFAALGPKPELIQELIEAGVAIDELDAEGNTALHLAARAGKSKGVAVLLKLGAQPSLKNKKGKTPQALARNDAIRELFLESTSSSSAQTTASTPTAPSTAPIPSTTPVALRPVAPTTPVAVQPAHTPNTSSTQPASITQSPTPAQSTVQPPVASNHSPSDSRLAQAEAFRLFMDNPKTIKLPNGAGYQGGIKDGEFNGFGILRNRNREGYEGEWEDGKKHGVGTYLYSNGNSLAGSWKNDTPHGPGVFVFANGGTITGTWKYGILVSGEGVYIRKDGTQHFGIWRNNELISTRPVTDPSLAQ